MKRSKGFTLIELLAVIVVLAVIALIATPIVLSLVNNAKKGAAESSATAYVKAVENGIMAKLIKDSSANIKGTFTIASSKNKIVNEAGTEIDVDVKGSLPAQGGTIVIGENGTVTSATLIVSNYEVECDENKCEVKGKKQEEEEPEKVVTGPTSEDPDATKTKGLIKIVYLDPTDLTKTCDATNSISTTGTNEGCMKWYAYDETDTTYTMILDHNTTATIAWDINGTTNQVSDENFTQKLESDTAGWNESLNPRIINAIEVTKITSYPNFNILTTTDWFYLDTNNQTKTATTQGASKYAWLFDYTSDCLGNGCNIADSQTKGYWANSYGIGNGEYIWTVYKDGNLGGVQIFDESSVGIRPVITISKDIIKK